MTTIRRIYAYLLAFAGLAMVAVAGANLGQLFVDLLFQASPATNPQYVRDTVALYAAAALIGLPVWLLHWLWTERMARADERERASTLRRLYVYAVLAASMAQLAFSVRESLFVTAAWLTGARLVAPTLEVAVRQLPFAVVALLVWLGHWRIAARDRDLVGERGGSATLRRWYLYAAAFLGLLTLLSGATGVLEVLWRTTTQPASQGPALDLAAPAAGALVGLAVWFLHWAVLPESLPEPARRDDGTAVLRSVYLFLALGAGVVGTLVGASQLLYYTVGRLLGVEHPGGVGGDLVQAAAGPASVTIVYAAAWAYQRQALRRQATAFAEAPRQAGTRRLYSHVVALIALSVLAGGAAGLLWTLGDVLLNTPAVTAGDGWRGNVALYATLTLVGLPVWLLHWRPVALSESETRSLARRLYLYLSLIAAMLGLIGSAAAVLYRLFGLLLGASSSASLLTDLAHGLAVASVAAMVVVYHWRILRTDTPRMQATSVETAGPGAEAVVQIRAVDAAALERALAALRSTGVEVAVIT